VGTPARRRLRPGADHRLYHKPWDIRSGWGGWSDLWGDADVASDPAALSWAAQRLDVFFANDDRDLAANVWW